MVEFAVISYVESERYYMTSGVKRTRTFIPSNLEKLVLLLRLEYF